MAPMIKGTNLRSTAASRLAFEDLKAGELIGDLDTVTNDLVKATDALRLAKDGLAEAQDIHDGEHQIRVSTEVDAYHANTTKPVQAELDRIIKRAVAEDDELQLKRNAVWNAKRDLDEKQAEYDKLRYQQRALVSQAGVVTQVLNFLAASKTARAAALGQLSDL